MTYASVGGQVDVEVTAAVNVVVNKEDRETGRTPNAAVWADHKFDRIDLEGQIEITNRIGKPIKLEVVRHVVGIGGWRTWPPGWV